MPPKGDQRGGFNGGEAQRIGIARQCLPSPEVCFSQEDKPPCLRNRPCAIEWKDRILKTNTMAA